MKPQATTKPEHASCVTNGAHWRVVESDSRLELLPGRANLWAFAVFGVAFECIVAVLLFLRMPDAGTRAFILIGAAFAYCIIGVFLYEEIRRGAYLIYNSRLGTIALPRIEISFPLTVPMLLTVTPYQVQMYDGRDTAFELILVTGNDDERRVFPIVASLTRNAVDSLAQQLSDRTGILVA